MSLILFKYLCFIILSAPANHVIVCIWIVSDEGSRNKFSVSVPHDAKPIDVISETIRRRGRLMNITKEQVEGLIETYRTAYALKVCGCDEFLLEEYPISQYKVMLHVYYKEILISMNR